LTILNRFKKAIDKHVVPSTFPMAIKLLRPGEDVPTYMERPLRELGERIRPCVAWHFVRHEGLSVAMLADDFSTACPLSIFIFGIMKPIQPWIEGNLAYGTYTKSKEAAANMERHVFRLDVGKYAGIALSPLEKADFEPDLVMIYCNSRQAQRLVAATAWTNGDPLKIGMTARAVCSEGVIQPLQIGRPVLAIPCAGDRRHGGTQDDELVFTTPVKHLGGIIEGLEGANRSRRIINLRGESKLRKRYSKMAKTLDEELGR
jgi:uncharacterized protein (DUF169 family)